MNRVPVVLEDVFGVGLVGPKVDVAEGLLDGVVVGVGVVGHIAEGVEEAHGQGEGQAQHPDGRDQQLREHRARLAPKRVHYGAVSERTKRSTVIARVPDQYVQSS